MLMYGDVVALLVSREKLENEILTDRYGMKEPVHFVKKSGAYRVYIGINNAGDEIVYAVKENEDD